MKRAVVLLSGGIDSTTTMAIAKNKGFEVYALSFDYGQKHKIELELARQSAERFNVKKLLIQSFDLRAIGGSALTSDIEVPKDRKALSVMRNELKEESHITHHTSHITDIPVTYVPARNTIFLSFALAWAETINTGDIFIGANAVDYSGYPDCRPKFIKAFEDMANLATKVSVEGRIKFKIHAPLILFTKSEIIKRGSELGVDFSLTWSCYDPECRTEFPTSLVGLNKEHRECYIPCMRCDSCLLRVKGFKEAGINDPLILKEKH